MALSHHPWATAGPWRQAFQFMKSVRKIKVAQFGLGPIGVATLGQLTRQPWAEIIGAIDHNPAKSGQDLGKVTGLNGLRRRRVFANLDELLAGAGRPDVIIHAAVSRLSTALPQIQPMVRKGINVVSSCEELLFPWLREPGLAGRLDRLCRRTRARVVGTGVNPGFVMDLLPLCLASATCEVREVHVRRVVDASTRRGPLQKKIGSGLKPKDFRRLLKAGQAGHTGLRESAALIARGLGWEPKTIVENGEPIIAERDIRTEHVRVRKGETCGLHQRAEARIDGRLCLTLDLKMYLGAPDPHDAIQIKGNPSLELVLPGGIAGDQATVAALVNTVPRLLRADPGLLLVTDLPLAAAG
jgi:4-hydroxy-tetrahydrodipicolinate reductase